MKRSGVADLPLQGGRVPPWLAERMTKLGTAIVESVLYHYGTGELMSRLSNPFWFQALGSDVTMVQPLGFLGPIGQDPLAFVAERQT